MKRSPDQRQRHTQMLEWNISTITAVFLDQKRVNVCEHTAKIATWEWCHFYHVFTYIYFLLIEKDSCDRWKVSIKLPHVCVCLMSRKSFLFPFLFFVLFVLWYFPFHVVSSVTKFETNGSIAEFKTPVYFHFSFYQSWEFTHKTHSENDAATQCVYVCVLLVDKDFCDVQTSHLSHIILNMSEISPETSLVYTDESNLFLF